MPLTNPPSLTTVHYSFRLSHFLSFLSPSSSPFFFFFTDPATTEIYTLSLHDALPICQSTAPRALPLRAPPPVWSDLARTAPFRDRKSTRLNSSHMSISYAVFCLKKKKKKKKKMRK